MSRIDVMSGNMIGKGEDAVFEIIQKATGLLQEENEKFPNVGIYRQLPISLIYDKDQMSFLAPYHIKSSIDIFLVPFYDEYTPKLSRIAIRVEGNKGDLKMLRQNVQRDLLEKWCRVVDVFVGDKRGECPQLAKDLVNEKSINELKQSFKTCKVELPGDKEFWK